MGDTKIHISLFEFRLFNMPCSSYYQVHNLNCDLAEVHPAIDHVTVFLLKYWSCSADLRVSFWKGISASCGDAWKSFKLPITMVSAWSVVPFSHLPLKATQNSTSGRGCQQQPSKARVCLRSHSSFCVWSSGSMSLHPWLPKQSLIKCWKSVIRKVL